MYKWRVKKSERGISLENFIYQKLGDWSHKQVKTAIDNKRAFVNGKNVFVSKWNLKPNALVVFSPSEKDLPQLQPGGRYRFIDVLYEDVHILAANKPAHVDFETYVKTVQDYLKRKNKGQGYPYLGQMHRLDKETSGVMLFTKKKVANALADQFRDHSIQKFYVALVDGRVDQEQGRIDKAIEKGQFEEGRKVRVVSTAKGKKSTTLFRVLERYNRASLLRVEILTGRTHQIRIHLSDQGYPVVGDKVYGKPAGVGFRRQALHAERIDFKHPVSKAKMKIVAPIPKDMLQLIELLREES